MVHKSSRPVEALNIHQATNNIRDQADQDEAASLAIRASIEMLILVVSLLGSLKTRFMKVLVILYWE
jgi:hypothetical protein